MKRIRINAYQAGLVFKRGTYKRMLTEGSHWLFPSETAYVYEKALPFFAPVELGILLEDEKVAEALDVVEVADHQVALHYVNGLLHAVLTPGRYAFWKSSVRNEFIRADVSKIEITEPIDRTLLTHRLLQPFVRSYSIESFERGLLFIDGKFSSVLESGTYFWWKNAIQVHVAKVDTRQQQAEISGQEILTRDKAMIRVASFAQYKVVHIEKAVVENKDHERQLYVAFQLALREYIGTMTLDELLEKKETISPFILEAVKRTADALGVDVTGFGIRDIILPGDVKEIMNGVLIAEKKAQANIIMRREETASTRSLLNTAKLMEDNPVLLKLKEMEYVERIADKVNSISVHGDGVLIDQLRQIFIPRN
jgi:regulator of protease activity HflC (stomatin/prohibitin superfamily)